LACFSRDACASDYTVDSSSNLFDAEGMELSRGVSLIEGFNSDYQFVRGVLGVFMLPRIVGKFCYRQKCAPVILSTIYEVT
jgi:hypothetical protein